VVHPTKHIAITGAGSGIGRALALRYAAPGIVLSLVGRDPRRMQETADGCIRQGARVESGLFDVTQAPGLALWLEGRDADRPIDTVIAAAGLGGRDVVPGPCGESAGQAAQIFGTNVLGVVNTVSPLLPRMVERGAGRIVVIGSMAGWLGMPQGPAYSGSKAAVAIYADGLRRLLAPRGVRVTTVLPGFVDTPMSRSLDLPRPWCWTAERAAERIVAAIESGTSICVFPWQLRLAFMAVSLLPLTLRDLLLVEAGVQVDRRSAARD
jgi:short-subunit dehydrogenase